MEGRRKTILAVLVMALVMLAAAAGPAMAQEKTSKKPNIILILSDDFGYGDAGVYGGGPGRGMPTPNLDRMADEGMTFYSFYAQPSCTPGRAAVQTGRIPNRSGMTTVAFQGQGGGLPKAEWTLASVLKKAGYQTYFTGKWHLGEADYALPNAQGYDEMKYCFLYHLNAYTYGDPKWFPDMSPELRAMFQKVTKGSLSGKAGEKAKQDFKVNGEYVNTPEKGVVGIPFLDEYVEKLMRPGLDPESRERVRDAIGKLLNRSREGTERVKQIVEDLRTFSRTDQAELQEVCVNDELDRTLVLITADQDLVEVVVKNCKKRFEGILLNAKVVDMDGKPLRGVSVVISCDGSPGYREVKTTNRHGVFQIEILKLHGEKA